MAKPGVISSTRAVLASSQAVAAGSSSGTLGLLRWTQRNPTRMSALRFSRAANVFRPCFVFRRGYRTLTSAGVCPSSGLDEVLVGPRRRRPTLTLVFRPGLAGPVRVLGG